MRTILAVIIAALSVGTSSAIEYVTLREDGESIRTNSTDIIQVVGVPTGLNVVFHAWKTVNGIEQYWNLRQNPGDAIRSTETGISKIRFSPGNSSPGDGLTLKITNASELNKVGPTTVLVLPENSQGNYDLIIESSFDLGIWTPFHSQAVQSDTARRLFRVRIVHKEGEGAAVEGEER